MLWIKALHLFAVIAWLAGLFYLPRIFVHYAEGAIAGEDVRRLVVMARRLFKTLQVRGAYNRDKFVCGGSIHEQSSAHAG